MIDVIEVHRTTSVKLFHPVFPESTDTSTTVDLSCGYGIGWDDTTGGFCRRVSSIQYETHFHLKHTLVFATQDLDNV